MKFINSFLLRWKFEYRYYPRDFINGIKNIWYWFKVIWKDRDWDGHYFYIIMRHKLRKIRKYKTKYGHHVGDERRIERIKLAEELLTRLINETYATEHHKYWDIEAEFVEPEDEESRKKGYKQMEVTYTRNELDQYLAKYPKIKAEAEDRLKKMKGYMPQDKDRHIRMIAYTMANIRHNKAKRILYKLLNEHVEDWWD